MKSNDTTPIFDFFEREEKGMFFMSRYRTVLRTKASRWLLALSVLLLAALFFCSPGLVPTAHAASAHAQVPTQPNTSSHCGNLGSLIETHNLYAYPTSTKIGEFDVYYNSSTGYNCAYLWSAGPSWGVSKDMYVEIDACAQTSPGPACSIIASDADPGSPPYPNYSYYAGPVGVYAPGHCIQAQAHMAWNGYLITANTSPSMGHCG
jgi:hypothetical protein